MPYKNAEAQKMRFPYLLGILSFALISQASGAGLTLTGRSAPVSSEGGTYSFFVETSFNWLLETNDWSWSFSNRTGDWSGGIVTSPESSVQFGNQTFTYYVPPNLSTSSRTQQIRVSKSGRPGATRYFTITQSGAAATLSLSSSSSSYGASGSGGARSFTVTSNTSWRWSGKPSWVITTESTSQSRNQSFSYSVSANTSPSSRSATLTFTTTSGGNTQTRTHRITQDPAPSLSLNSQQHIQPPIGGTYSFNVNSNTQWSWSSSAEWVSSTVPSTQSFSLPFQYTLEPNTSTSSRIAQISFGFTVGDRTVYQNFRITQQGDTKPPVIKLTGSSRMTVEADRDSEYTDQGATCSDAVDGNLDAAVEVSGDVIDMRQPGTYTILYNCRDTAGNEATQVKRQVTVVDTTPPVIKRNGSKTIYVEANREGTYTDQGATCSDSLDGRIDAAVEVSGDIVDMRQPGTYILRYNCQDAAGNQATEVIRTVHVKDTLPPVITLVGPPTLTIEASREAEYTDQGATCLDEVDGNLSHAVEVSGQVVDLRQPGTYILRYDCQDAAGNEAAEVIRTILVRDTLPPVITLSGDDPENTEAGFAYEEPGANAGDALDGNVDVVIDHTGVDTGVVGNHSVTFSATDAAQNTATAGRNVLVRDTLPPVISLHLQERAIHVGEHGQLGINGVINAPDGLPVEDERNPGDNVTPVPGPRGEGTIRETPFTQPDGTPVVSRQKWVIRAGAGEEEPHLPIARAWDHGDADLEVSTTITLIDLDGNAEETVVSEVDFSRRSTYLFRYDVRDSAGNHAEQAAIALIIDDQQAPVISLEGNEQEIIEAGSRWTLPEASVVDNIDGDLSENIRYQVDEVSNSENPIRLGEELTHAQASSLIDTSAPSNYLVTLNVHDQAGIYGQDNSNNQATARRRIQVRDTLAPVITLTGERMVVVEAGFPYQDAGATSSDRVDGNVEISIDGADIDTNIVGSKTITYTATDAAGNESELTRTVNVIVTRAPAITNLSGVGAPKALRAVSITFGSFINARYAIERSRDLVRWKVLREVQSGGRTTKVTIDEPGRLDNDWEFYRVRVLKPKLPLLP